MESKHNTIVGIIAPKGSGKTTLAAQFVKAAPRVAVFDLMSDEHYAAVCEDAIVASPKAFAEVISEEKFSVLYRPGFYDTESRECPGFTEFISICYARGSMLIVIDEAHLLCTPHSIPAPLKNAAMLGRHKLIDLCYITQSFTLVARPLTLNTDRFVFFNIIDPRDLDGIAERCGGEIADQTQALARLEIGEKGEVIPGEMLIYDSRSRKGEILQKRCDTARSADESSLEKSSVSPTETPAT